MSRISEGATLFNISVQPATPRADGKVYRVRDIFTTRDGSWEVQGVPGGITQWARDTYLKGFNAPDYFDDAGGDHHMFGGVYNEVNRNMENNAVVHYWTWTDDGNHVDMPVKVKSGWANVLMFNKFDHTKGVQGAWAWKIKSDIPSDIVRGGGMPGMGWHVSFFASFFLATEGIVVPPVDPPPSDLAGRVAKLEANARAWSVKYPGGPQYG